MNVKSNAMSPRMRAQTRWEEGSEKQLEICVKAWVSIFFFLPVRFPADMMATTRVSVRPWIRVSTRKGARPPPSPDQSRHSEHGTIESGRENGNM